MSDTSMAVEGGRLVKMEVDYSVTCDEKIPECEKMAKQGRLHDAIDALLALEKQTRTGADMVSTGRVLVAIVRLCHEAAAHALLNEQVVALARRRAQLKQAVAAMVQECVKYVDTLPAEPRLRLIHTLRSVTDGKIYVEVERARLTLRLAHIKEAEGDVAGAAEVMQELQVETYGSMEKREKVELILEQMRLCLAKKDYIRTQIISKKINIKFFEDADAHDLKLKYYRLMIELDVHEGAYLSVCKHYRAILGTSTSPASTASTTDTTTATPATPSVTSMDTSGPTPLDAEARSALQCAILYLILAPYDNEQADLTHRLLQDKLLQDDTLRPYRKLLKVLTTAELIKWSSLVGAYESLLKEGTPALPATGVFSGTQGASRWSTLRSRVVQHNIRVMAKYYTRISLARMAQLLDMSLEETEETLCEMVVGKSVEARVDRPAGVVVFATAKRANDVLNDWGHSLSSLMRLVNDTTHLINKEHMIHKHLAPSDSAVSLPAAAAAQN